MEAAFVLPLFVFFVIVLLTPMQWLDTQRKIQTAAESYGETLSQYAAFIEDEDSGYKNLLTDTAATLWLKNKLKEISNHDHRIYGKVLNEHGDIYFLQFIFQP